MAEITRKELILALATHSCRRKKHGDGANLVGVDLSGLDLRGLDISHCDLSRANLRRCNLTGVSAIMTVFVHSDLTGANLTRAEFESCHFQSSSLSRANLTGATLTGVDLESSDLSGANLTGAKAIGVSFGWVDFRGAKLIDMRVDGGRFTHNKWAGVKVRGGDWTDVTRPDLGAAELPFAIPIDPARPPRVYAPPPPKWRNVAEPSTMLDGNRWEKRLPHDPVRPLARPGMVVRLIGDHDDYAIIDQVTRDVCLVRKESGERLPLFWHEVELACVAPDTSWLKAVIATLPEAVAGRKRKGAA
jgi:uncharacterized protein YjbI with pentapeptide repeats